MLVVLREPNETDNIDCHLQQIGMGTLICRAARQTGDKTTNEVKPIDCFHCQVGKIYREVGCDAVTPKITIYPNYFMSVDSLFCKIRKREINLEICKNCNLVTAETTKNIISTTRGLFEAQGFYSSYKDIEAARLAMRDGNFENTITRSISSVESVMKVCLEKLEQQLPDKKQVSDLWKSLRQVLKFDELDSTGRTANLINSLSGLINNLGSLRNTLGDAHGKGLFPPATSESIAELALNTSSTLSTIIIRRYNQIKEDNDERDST